MAHFSVLTVGDGSRRKLLTVALRHAGYAVTLAASDTEALAALAKATPDLIIADVTIPGSAALGIVLRLRADPRAREIPVILLTAQGGMDAVVPGFGFAANDCLPEPFPMAELLARVRAKTGQQPVPSDVRPRDRRTGHPAERAFYNEVARELDRAARTGRPGHLAYLAFDELPRLRDRLGARSVAEIAAQAAALIAADARPVDVTERDSATRFMLLLPEMTDAEARSRLARLALRIVNHPFAAGDERLRLTPLIAVASFDPAVSAHDLRARARRALEDTGAHLDLRPVHYDVTRHGIVAPKPEPGWWARLWVHLRLPVQFLLVNLATIAIPLVAYIALERAGVRIVPVMYLVVVCALLLTAFLIWVEGFLALEPTAPPEEPGVPYPPASAIIAADLTNEAATVIETLEAFLRVAYPAPFQIILAYNTPHDLPVEAQLRALARREPRFVPLHVAGSTSKAQNVNAALAAVRGEFVGIFDADHHPAPDTFMRAWRWLSNGYDIVQGHCAVRNGGESWVARMVAVEFESLYAASHPGRERLHHFGIFGGSNGYWKTDVLRRIRMRGDMLTEDIDATFRALLDGYRIASDRSLIARELAPTTLEALVHQRSRWAQGWFQVARKYTWRGLRSRPLSVRQKLGILHLLAWRELYPYLAMQMFPIIAYWIWTYGSVNRIDWLIPIFVLTSIFTLTTGPGQVLFAYLLAVPEIRRHRRWFLAYLITSSLFYTALKNLIAVVSQVKELMRERRWRVTPRGMARKT